MSIAKELVELENLLRSGTLSRDEFETAKRLVLSGKSATESDSLMQIKNQNDVAQLNREWSFERQNYMVSNRRGPSYIPTKGSSVVGGIVIVLFGCFWTAMAVSITAFAPFPIFPLAYLFPAFGVLFVILGAASAICSYTKAERYSEAEAAYRQRRQELINKQ